MSSHPWLKFYPRDWRGDQALRAVSLAARGLWMECLCIMHEAKPYGHLLINGEKVGDEILARMTGVSVDEARALLDELRKAGVPSIRRDGVVFSRRMVSDFGRSQKGRNSVNLRYEQAAEIEEENNQPTRSPSTVPITQIAEARNQKEKKYSVGFEKFWGNYPKRPTMSKLRASREYEKLSEPDKNSADRSLLPFKAQLTRDKTEPQFIVHAEKYLRDRRFDGFADALAEVELAGVVVERGSPEWRAWEQHENLAGRPMHYSPRINGWRFPAEYPPQKQAAE